MVKRGLQLPKVLLNNISLSVQGPESVTEQVRSIVPSLKLDELAPVDSCQNLRSFFLGSLTTGKLKGRMSGCSLEWEGKEEAHTLGRGPPCTTGFNFLSNHR